MVTLSPFLPLFLEQGFPYIANIVENALGGLCENVPPYVEDFRKRRLKWISEGGAVGRQSNSNLGGRVCWLLQTRTWLFPCSQRGTSIAPFQLEVA